MKSCKYFRYFSLLFLVFFLISESNGQGDPLSWGRLPTDSEIQNAQNAVVESLGGTISVNGEVVDSKTVASSQIIKFHNKRLAGINPPQTISGAGVFVQINGIAGSFVYYYSLIQNAGTGEFHFIRIGPHLQNTSLNGAYQNRVSEISSDPNTDFGFAPPLSSSNDDLTSEPGSSSDDDSIIWEVIIGTITAAAVVGILSRRKKIKSKKKKEKEEEKEEEITGL